MTTTTAEATAADTTTLVKQQHRPQQQKQTIPTGAVDGRTGLDGHTDRHTAGRQTGLT